MPPKEKPFSVIPFLRNHICCILAQLHKVCFVLSHHQFTQIYKLSLASFHILFAHEFLLNFSRKKSHINRFTAVPYFTVFHQRSALPMSKDTVHPNFFSTIQAIFSRIFSTPSRKYSTLLGSVPLTPLNFLPRRAYRRSNDNPRLTRVALLPITRWRAPIMACTNGSTLSSRIFSL